MLHGFNFSKLAFIVNISFYVFKYRQFSLPSIPGTYSTLYLCGAHPIKPTVTWLLPDHAIRVKSQKRIERLFWTLNWFSEPNFKIDPFQLAWFSWLLMPWASEKGAEPPGFWNFEQKRLFFSFEWEKTNFTTFAPPHGKILENPLVAALEKVLSTPMFDASLVSVSFFDVVTLGVR